MPINITEEFVRNLMEQNAALITQVANLTATVAATKTTATIAIANLNTKGKKFGFPISNQAATKK